jgi:hypothetical protein
MEAAGPSAKLTRFANPSENLSGLDPETAADLLAAASDLSLVIDARGIVRDVAFSSADLAREVYRSWIGAKWVDTVTVESRIKVEELLKEATENVPTRWRQFQNGREVKQTINCVESHFIVLAKQGRSKR